MTRLHLNKNDVMAAARASGLTTLQQVHDATLSEMARSRSFLSKTNRVSSRNQPGEFPGHGEECEHVSEIVATYACCFAFRSEWNGIDVHRNSGGLDVAEQVGRPGLSMRIAGLHEDCETGADGSREQRREESQ